MTSLSQPVVVSFFASWCAGCRRLHPKLMQIAGQNPHITFLKVGRLDHVLSVTGKLCLIASAGWPWTIV